jgi:hypothetical protein
MNQETTNSSLTNDLSRCQRRTRTGRRRPLAAWPSPAALHLTTHAPDRTPDRAY